MLAAFFNLGPKTHLCYECFFLPMPRLWIFVHSFSLLSSINGLLFLSCSDCLAGSLALAIVRCSWRGALSCTPTAGKWVNSFHITEQLKFPFLLYPVTEDRKFSKILISYLIKKCNKQFCQFIIMISTSLYRDT